MNMKGLNVWFIVLCCSFCIFSGCSSARNFPTYDMLRLKSSNKQNATQLRSAETTATLKPAGKFFPWKKPVPQTNLILITRPTVTTPTTTTTTTSTTVTTPTTTTTTTGRRRKGNGNRRPVRRRPRPPQPSYARTETKKQQQQQKKQTAGGSTYAEVNNQVNGVSSKLDMDQWGRSRSHIGMRINKVNNANDVGQVAVELNRRKPKTPQTAAIFLPAFTTTTNTAMTVNAAKKQNQMPTYVTATITNGYKNKNNNNKKKKKNKTKKNKEPNKQSIWQKLAQPWHQSVKNKTTIIEKENANKHEIVIDDHGKIHIKKKRTKSNHKKEQNDNDDDDEEENLKEEEDIMINNMENVNSIINEKNTNSHLQNLINAFSLRTPIIYKRQH